jgi:hypothetical protein
MKEKPHFVAQTHLGVELREDEMRKRHAGCEWPSRGPECPKEVMAVMFVLVEKAPGAFTLRLAQNDEVIKALDAQGAMQTFLNDADELYANWRNQLGGPQKPSRTNSKLRTVG